MSTSLQYNIFVSAFTLVGCAVSPSFAAAVLAGVAGVALACVIVLAKTGGPSHPLNMAFEKGRSFLSRAGF